MKRMALLAFLLLCVSFSAFALASPGYAPDWGEPEGEIFEATYDGVTYAYTLNENGEATIVDDWNGVSELCQKEDASVPSSLDGHTVTGIGHDAFGHYNGMISCHAKSLYIPASITFMGVNPFRGWYTLETITVDAANPRFEVVDGALYDAVDRRLVFCPLTIEGSFTVKEGTRVIGAMAFGEWDSWGSRGCSIEQVFLSDSVEEIGDYAFSLSAVQSINLPSSLKSIGECAFSNTPLTEITFNDGLESIGAFAFEYTDITSVTLPESLVTISADAFTGCKSLTEINASERVKEMLRVKPEDYILYELDADGNATVTGICFATDDKTLVIPSTLDGHPVTGIGKDAFSRLNEVSWTPWQPTCLALPASITFIDPASFQMNRSHITDIIVDPANENYESVDGVLYDRKNHVLLACLYRNSYEDRTVRVKEGTRAIGEYAFCGKEPWDLFGNSRIAVILPESLTEIREGAFANCELDVIEIPSGVKMISPHAFEHARMNSLMFDEGTQTIGYSAFYNALIRSKVLLPPSLERIEAEAFNSARMPCITLNEGLQYIGDNAFAENYGYDEISLPDSLAYIGSNAFTRRFDDAITIMASERVLNLLKGL